ncbi:LOW QUALITY PROTEIN: hypothetical protein HID58_018275, partial [Brassica napus]
QWGIKKKNIVDSGRNKSTIKLFVEEAIKRGWRDFSGIINKAAKIKYNQPTLNERVGCQKFHKHYQAESIISIFNVTALDLDEMTKQKASEEVWQGYLKAHPNHQFMRYDSHEQFDDLKIIFDSTTTNGGNSLGLSDTTDATCYNLEELQNDNNDSMALSLVSYNKETRDNKKKLKKERRNLDWKRSNMKLEKKKKNNVWDAMKEITNDDLLSMLMTKSSFFMKKSVPLGTFLGTITTSASTVAGTKIFKLPNTKNKTRTSDNKRNFHNCFRASSLCSSRSSSTSLSSSTPAPTSSLSGASSVTRRAMSLTPIASDSYSCPLVCSLAAPTVASFSPYVPPPLTFTIERQS